MIIDDFFQDEGIGIVEGPVIDNNFLYFGSRIHINIEDSPPGYLQRCVNVRFVFVDIECNCEVFIGESGNGDDSIRVRLYTCECELSISMKGGQYYGDHQDECKQENDSTASGLF